MQWRLNGKKRIGWNHPLITLALEKLRLRLARMSTRHTWCKNKLQTKGPTHISYIIHLYHMHSSPGTIFNRNDQRDSMADCVLSSVGSCEWLIDAPRDQTLSVAADTAWRRYRRPYRNRACWYLCIIRCGQPYEARGPGTLDWGRTWSIKGCKTIRMR